MSQKDESGKVLKPRPKLKPKAKQPLPPSSSRPETGSSPLAASPAPLPETASKKGPAPEALSSKKSAGPPSGSDLKRNSRVPLVPMPKDTGLPSKEDSSHNPLQVLSKPGGGEALFNLMYISRTEMEGDARRVGKNTMLLLPVFIMALLTSDLLIKREMVSLIPITIIALLFLFLLSIRVDYELTRSPIEIYENGLCLSTVKFSRAMMMATMAFAIFQAAVLLPALSVLSMDFRYAPFEMLAILIFAMTYLERGQKGMEKKAINTIYSRDGADSANLSFYRKGISRGKRREGVIDKVYISNADSRTSVFNEVGVVTSDGRIFESGPKDAKEIRQISNIMKRQWPQSGLE